MQIVVGIDPGLRYTGYSVLAAPVTGPRRFQLVEAGLVRAEPDRPLENRLLQLYHGIRDLMQQHRPAAVAVEDLYAHYAHPRTAILMGHARGIVLLAAAESGAQVHHYPPARVKMSLTGNGAASKRQMQLMVQSILGLEKTPEPDHVADAIAVGLCHIFTGDSQALTRAGAGVK